MAHVSYPRPREEAPRGGSGPLLIVALSAGVLATLVGLLSAFDLLVVGEELTLLSDRAHRLFSLYGDGVHYGGERLLGLTVLLVSLLRPFLAVGLTMRRRWGYQLGAGLMVPCALLDVASSTLPVAALMLVFDAVVFFHSVRKPSR